MNEPQAPCSVCADEALPAVVRSTNAADGTALVEICSELRTVALDLIDMPRPGDTILVHQGFAIARLAAQ